MLDPETGLIIFVIAGIGAVVTFVAFGAAEKLGPNLDPGDLLPASPFEGPPVPRFMIAKPQLLESLMARR